MQPWCGDYGGDGDYHGGDVGGGDNDDGRGFSHDDHDGCDGGIEMKETNSERMWPGGRENYKESWQVFR